MSGNEADLSARHEQGPDHEYGNKSPIEVVQLKPRLDGGDIDPHASMELDNPSGVAERAPFTEAELQEKIAEIAENYLIVGDPKSTEDNPRQFGMTVVNKDKLHSGRDVIFIPTTQGSSLYDEEGNPNNEGNALELAYTALKYPDMAVVLSESPGTGNSSDLTDDEYKQASKDGKLVEDVRDTFGKITRTEPFETMQAWARALDGQDINISHISANASGAHFVTALAVALPGYLRRVFLYNATNISDRNPAMLTLATFNEIRTQSRYSEASRDPLRITDERKQMARKTLGSERKRRIDQARAQTHNPLKMWRQQRIFSRGNRHGQSAVVHAVAGQLAHPEARTTHVFPEFAAQYKRSEDFVEFVRLVNRLGGHAISILDVESLKIPLGQYGHSHYPSVRQTLEGYAFNR